MGAQIDEANSDSPDNSNKHRKRRQKLSLHVYLHQGKEKRGGASSGIVEKIGKKVTFNDGYLSVRHLLLMNTPF